VGIDFMIIIDESAELPTRSEEVAVITGGTRGIGFETIKLLLQCDFTVILGECILDGDRLCSFSLIG